MNPEKGRIDSRLVTPAVACSVLLAVFGLTSWLTGSDDSGSGSAAAATPPAPGWTRTDVATTLASAPLSPPAAPIVVRSASGLGLVLKGVLMTRPASDSTALISVNDGPAALYGVGQSPGGIAVIQSIGVDHVVLSQAGQSARLAFATVGASSPTSSSGAVATPPAAAMRSPEAQAALASASPIAMAAEAAARAARPLPPVTGPAPDIGQAARSVGAVATAGGYRIGPNPSPELRRFGLQPGDVVESVNGQAVGAGAGDGTVLERARSAGQARVVVLRGGRRSTFTFSLR